MSDPNNTPGTDGLVVVDIQTPVFCKNRLFDLDYARQFPGAEAFAQLAISLGERGVRTVTADVFLAEPSPSGPTACLSIEQTQYTDAVLTRPGVVPAVCLSLESPIMIVPFYQAIPTLSGQYQHMFLWPGARSRVTGGAAFHEISWPYPAWACTDRPATWAEKKFLTLVSGNKRAFPWPRPLFDLGDTRASVRALRSALQTSALRLRDPWFRSELYVERLRAIEHFSRDSDFDLFGRGWENASSTLPARTARAVARCYRGEIPSLDKTRVTSEYKFALCYENTSFPGYITEKIFDCFSAGCIPVYWGAPDIAAAVPPESFIDATSFRNYGELEQLLRGMTSSEAQRYLEAAHRFMESPAAERFGQGRFVDAISSVLIQSLQGSR